MSMFPPELDRCPHCFEALPCKRHPAPPKLAFAGGTHFEEELKKGLAQMAPVKPLTSVKKPDGFRLPPVEFTANNDERLVTDDMPDDGHELPKSMRTEKPAEKPAPKLLRTPSSFQSPKEVLGAAMHMDLENVVVISQGKNGELLMMNSGLRLADVNWMLDQTKVMILVDPSDVVSGS